MEKEIEKVFVDLIRTELNLPKDYGKTPKGDVIPCVTIKSQNIKLFNTEKIQITISTISSNVFSNRTYPREVIVKNENNQNEVHYIEDTYINERRIIQIDVYSRNNEARQRFVEVQAALNSTYSQQLQDQYQFRIGTISNAQNTSGLEGGSDINRYTIRCNCITWYKKSKEIEYYDTFGVQVRNSNNNIFADLTIE